MASTVYAVGDTVQVNYLGKGKWFPARIAAVPYKTNKGKTFDCSVEYKDTKGKQFGVMFAVVKKAPKKTVGRKRRLPTSSRQTQKRARTTSSLDCYVRGGSPPKPSPEQKKHAIAGVPYWEGDVQQNLPTRRKDGTLKFEDQPDFRPNLTPYEILRAGSFGGTYYRSIYSSVTKTKYPNTIWKEFPADWFAGMNVKLQVTRQAYRPEMNTYKVKCGGDLDMWESKGWITEQDPYGWFHWYCRFFLGRRSPDDDRQLGRWSRCCGPKGRWKNNLIGKVWRAGRKYDDITVSPVVRQTLQHWGYRLTEADYQKRVKSHLA